MRTSSMMPLNGPLLFTSAMPSTMFSTGKFAVDAAPELMATPPSKVAWMPADDHDSEWCLNWLSGTSPAADEMSPRPWLFGTNTRIVPSLKNSEQIDTESTQPDACVLSSLNIMVNSPFSPPVENVRGFASIENDAAFAGGGVGGG